MAQVIGDRRGRSVFVRFAAVRLHLDRANLSLITGCLYIFILDYLFTFIGFVGLAVPAPCSRCWV